MVQTVSAEALISMAVLRSFMQVLGKSNRGT